MQDQRPLSDDASIPSGVAAVLVDPAAYATPELDKAYKWLRQNNPLGICKAPGFDPFWVVTKHEDVLSVSRNNALFPSGELASILQDKAQIDRAVAITGTPHMIHTLVNMDGAEHRKYRGLTQAWFMPGNVRKREEQIRKLAVVAVDKMAALGGNCDFVSDVAVNLPLEVVMDILGVPPEDFPRMLRLTQELFGARDPDQQRAVAALTPEQMSAMFESVIQDFETYFAAISAKRRQEPQDDLATIIANAEINGEPIGEREASGYYMIVATAGHDTTSSSISCAMWALATIPGLLERLRLDASLIPAFIEEVLRWGSPVKTFMRSASEETELRGRKIVRGDWLMLCYGSANRDESIFPDPFSFDIDRKPNAQVAFGFGAHSCLGQHLARFETRILFEELLPRLKSVRLEGEPRSVESFFVSGLKTLPISYEMD